MKKIIFTAFVSSFILFSCTLSQGGASRSAKSDDSILNKEAAVMWQQTSSEYDALCYQAYNMAKKRVDEILENNNPSDLSIIMDLDETVLDNSPYNGYLIKNGKDYDFESWTRWVRLAKAELVPGALDFINYAEGQGFTIYYLSNRRIENAEFTIKNLNAKGIDVSQERLLLQDGMTSKADRRKLVKSKSEPMLLIGDNLADFLGEYEQDLGIIDRKEITEKMQEFYGVHFILLPNPMYGAWEKALKYNDPMIEEDENADKLKFLQSFE